MWCQDVLVTLWMIAAFTVGTVTFSPLNGVALSFVTTFMFWALLESQRDTAKHELP